MYKNRYKKSEKFLINMTNILIAYNMDALTYYNKGV